VQAIADDVVVMRRGEVLDQGKRDRVFSPPLNPYTAELLSATPELDPDWLTRKLQSGG